MAALFTLTGASAHDPAVDEWLSQPPEPLRSIARKWFAHMRRCGTDVHELVHDGCPVACVADAPFACVNVFRSHVGVGFFHGAALRDPARMLEGTGKSMRHVKTGPGRAVDDAALAELVRAAYLDIRARLAMERAAQPVLLAGGNPQIAKAAGDAPVQAYIAAMPGWKREVGRRLDALVVRTVPGVRKAVKWNSPFYGVAGRGWFLSFHCFTKYVKVTFFRGASLRPLPPGASKQKDVRYLDIYADDALDEARLADWVEQASRLPGWVTDGKDA